MHDAFDGALRDAVNFAEGLAKFNDMEEAAAEEAAILLGLLDRKEPSPLQRHAVLLGSVELRGHSDKRACLALALELGAEVYTADQVWEQSEVGCVIHLNRERRDSVQ